MAFSSSGTLKTPTMLEQLLEEINFQRTKEMRQLMKDDSGFVVLQGTTYWTDLFVRHFLFQADSTLDGDDLLFFVRKKHVKGSPRYLPKFETEVDVFRKDSRKLPIGDPDIDWEETVYLNLVIHQFEYTLTLAICTRTSPKELQVLRRHSQKVYASPSRRRMDTKGDLEEITYPHICFMVDNFDEVFHDILVRDGEMVCVELVASDRGGTVQGVIFLGSIRYDALKKVYDARQSSLGSKMAQRMTFGLFATPNTQRCEFVRMKGPQGKGHAEMAVTKPKGSGVETPTSEPGYCATDLWDSDWDEDPDDFYTYRSQRRLSDPSANLNNFVRGSWKTKLDAKSRSENEGLDSLDNGISEIEAGDLRDVKSRPASGGCCDCFNLRRTPSVAFSDVYCGHSKCSIRGPLGPNTGALCSCHTSSNLASLLASSEIEDKDKKKKRRKRLDNNSLEIGDDAAAQEDAATPTNTPVKKNLKSRLNANVENANSTTTTTTINSNANANVYITCNGKEELPCKQEIRKVNNVNNKNNKIDVDRNLNRLSTSTSTSSASKIFSYCTLPKTAKKFGGGNGFTTTKKRSVSPPKRVTADGTTIYYWCDLSKKIKDELDDGAYNPLWTMRGFTQTFHFWKENKRAQSVPLNAFLTYITLPWWSIAKDILDHREGPILTF